MTLSIFEINSPNDLKIYAKGSSLDEGPLPAFFYFALSGEESLSLDPFCQPVSFASELPMRCFSFTLPFHETGYPRSHAMNLWAKSFEEGSSLIEDFFYKAIENIDFLIHSNVIDKRHIAIGGLSRGGFVATQIAARHHKIGLLLGHAPLINLKDLSEFNTQDINLLFDCRDLIPRLLDKKVFFLIGNHDTRVQTSTCCNFIEKLASAMHAQGKRSPQAELHLFPSIGHQGHGTPPEIFKQGIEWIKKQWKF